MDNLEYHLIILYVYIEKTKNNKPKCKNQKFYLKQILIKQILLLQ
jgi:hypothetical protein